MHSSSKDESKVFLRGIVPPLVTPLTPAGRFDSAAYAKLMERVIAGGVHGLFVMGSTGEFTSFSPEFRRTIVRESCERAGTRIPVVVNVSDTCLESSLDLTGFAARAGAKAVAICPPFYFSVTQGDLVRYLTKFAESSELPVFLYNIPQNAHHELTPETVGRLAEVPNIVGLKNSNGRLDYTSEVVRIKRYRPDFAVLVGTEEILMPGVEAGADGGVPGGANMFPEVFVKLYAATVEGRKPEATTMQEQVVRMAESLYTVGAPQTSYFRGLKAALAELGVCGDTLAEPFGSFSGEEREELRSRLNRLLPDLN
jgi:dihydrodipicolinate synthase/N-acetylneuraminate lyase